MKKITALPMYLQIYTAVTAAILIVVLCTIALWLWLDDNQRHLSAFATFAEVVEDSLPPADAAPGRQAAAMQKWIDRTHSRFALFSPDGRLLSAPLEPAIPPPAALRAGGYFDDWYGTRFVWQLKDKRALVIHFSSDRARRPWLFMAMLFALASAVAVAAWPVVRHLTARLESLQRSVEQLGQGKLSARVAMEGEDEVGRLADSFNRSARQIEQLVNAQKNMLAYASHELRSPLTRIRMASSLIATEETPAQRELIRSVEELDALVDEILLMSRLETAQALEQPDRQQTDITAMAAEECARENITLNASHIIAAVEPLLLRRLMRNLTENAIKYGAQPVTASLFMVDHLIIFTLCDNGQGIDNDALPRLFEPFFRAEQHRRLVPGNGLGLALVRAIARHHGGDVRAENCPRGGACFTVHIPV